MRLKVQYKEIFEGISTFPGKLYHINTDPSIPPKWLPCQPVPVHQQDEFKKQLNEMLDAGVITEVHEATPWINSFVVETMKDRKKKLRICLDPKPLNKSIMCEPYITHTPDDVYHKLANAKYITVIDFKKSFWQFVLDEESSYLTNFNTPFGRYCYLRMPFGTNVSGDCIALQGIDSIYGKLDNVIGIADDLLIWGYEEDGSDHDHAFQSVLETTGKNNLKLNIAKIQYCQKKVTFFGETYTVDGHQPMPDKVQAVTGMTMPTSVTELQHFLGMFPPIMAEISEPLHQLTCKGFPFIWGPEHTEAFQLLKSEISTAPILRYYDPKKPVVLQTDVCTKELGAVLLQDGHSVYFASMSLTAAQQNYVAIQLEALVVSWAVQKFHHYLYRTSFMLQNDQKPLQAILSKSLVEATPWMQTAITNYSI